MPKIEVHSVETATHYGKSAAELTSRARWFRSDSPALIDKYEGIHARANMREKAIEQVDIDTKENREAAKKVLRQLIGEIVKKKDSKVKVEVTD